MSIIASQQNLPILSKLKEYYDNNSSDKNIKEIKGVKSLMIPMSLDSNIYLITKDKEGQSNQNLQKVVKSNKTLILLDDNQTIITNRVNNIKCRKKKVSCNFLRCFGL